MKYLGYFINMATELHPIPMGILVSVSMGMILTLPISSAAIAISLGLSGLAAGSAVVGCMADMETKVQAARLLVRSAHWKKDNGMPYSVDAAMAKLFAAETAMEVTTKAVQLHGGYGYTREYPVERMMRDAKITEIYEGTSEVQRMVIAGKLFK